MQRRELGVDRRLVGLERRRAPGEQVEDRGGREPRGDEALVHAVAGDRVDQPGRVADEQRALAGDPRARPPQRQPVAAQLSSALGLEPVRLAGPAQVLAQLRPLALPAADADVRVVALREDPGVAAGDVGQLEHEPARVALARERRVRDVPLVGDAVDDPVAEPDRLAR